MRLLLTRAAEDSTRTRAKLEAAGHRVIVSPVIKILPTGITWPTGVVDGVLATSGQAFSVMEGWQAPTPEARRLMPLFLVGERTAEVARRRGFVGPAVVAANAAMLAITMGQATDLPKRVLYLAGRDRKPDIETALDVVGHRPEVLDIYEAREAERLSPEAVDAIWRGTLGAALHFSRRSASLFVKLAEQAGLDVQFLSHICLSDDVAVPLRDAGCETVKVAAASNEASLLALIKGPPGT